MTGLDGAPGINGKYGINGNDGVPGPTTPPTKLAANVGAVGILKSDGYHEVTSIDLPAGSYSLVAKGHFSRNTDGLLATCDPVNGTRSLTIARIAARTNAAKQSQIRSDQIRDTCPSRNPAGPPMKFNRRAKGVTMRTRLIGALVLAVCISMVGMVGAFVPPAGALSGQNHPWVVVMCTFTDRQVEPHDAGYYSGMFSETGAGKGGAYDYWKDMSYGALDTTGTVVKGWFTVPITAYQFDGLTRDHKLKRCADASSGVDFSKFYGVIMILNHPAAQDKFDTTLASAMDTSTTTMTVASSTGSPPPPFPAYVDGGDNNPNTEEINVTGVSGTTWTVTRGYENLTTAKAHSAGAPVSVHTGADLFGAAPSFQLGGHPVATVMAAEDISLSAVLHEMGHGYGLNHSRRLTTSTKEYNDCYDIMSYQGCTYRFSGASFGSAPESGPGMDAIQLDVEGWIPMARRHDFDRSCNPSTITMAALNSPGAGGFLEARSPAVLMIAKEKGTSTTSDFYTVELRNQSGWDSGIPGDGILLHLHGQDGLSYWVDSAGRMIAGSDFADPSQKTFIGVNAIDSSTHTAMVTVGGCRIQTVLNFSGTATGDFNDRVNIGADLKVSGTLAPLPSTGVTLTIGGQSCLARTDAAGHAECSILLDQQPGSYSLTASYGGDAAYSPVTIAVPFVVTKEEAALTYIGDSRADYHDPATMSARLNDPADGAPISAKPVLFNLGSGDTCTAVTDTSGQASCPVVPNQPAGTTSVSASFAGDLYYRGANTSSPFEITKEETTAAYTGPTRIANGQPYTFTALLREDGAAPIAGRQMVITVGSGASAQGCNPEPVTDGTGIARCTLIPSQPLNASATVPVSAAFAGDAFYFPSSDSATLTVQFETGRAYGGSARIGLLGTNASVSPTPDTGAVRTAAASSTTTPCAASIWVLGLVTGTGLCANVTTSLNPGMSTATASVVDATIGLPGVPVITIRSIKATSVSTCTGATGATTFAGLSIGGITIDVSTIKPNTTIRVGSALIVLNEQTPVSGADAGMTVNGIHVSVSGLVNAEIVLASATSDIHNCV